MKDANLLDVRRPIEGVGSPTEKKAAADGRRRDNLETSTQRQDTRWYPGSSPRRVAARKEQQKYQTNEANRGRCVEGAAYATSDRSFAIHAHDQSPEPHANANSLPYGGRAQIDELSYHDVQGMFASRRRSNADAMAISTS